MKNLKNFQDDINKCSKCGLCQSVCPVYKETGNDCAVSRGKFIMLDGVVKGDLKLNKNIIKYIDMCLECGKCSEFCPSGIDVCKIFQIAKYEYAKYKFWGKFVFFLQSKYVFGNLIKLINKRYNFQQKKDAKLKLLYFKGCVGNIFPYTANLLKKIHDIEIIEKDFECCGMPFLSSGNLERFEEVKKYNIELIKEIDFDYILTDCASCESTLIDYGVFDKFISIGELLAKLNIKFKAEKPIKVTFHKPCHQKNIEFIKSIFENCENVEYIEMEHYDDCCGFAGEFGLKNRQLSKNISKKKGQNVVNTGADYVVTTCPSCILGLKQGLLEYKDAPKVLSLSEFLLKLST